jgi:hypothetical protein
LLQRRIAGLGRNGFPRLNFERGWHWEHVRSKANSI